MPYRFDAPEGVNFDTLDEVRMYASSISRTVIDQASMPVGGGVMEDDLVRLQVFLTCGL